MKSSVLVSAILATAFALSPVVHSADAPDRPPGVAKEAWIPINDRVGFVVVPSTKEPVRASPQTLMLMPPVSGYFMLKGTSGWTRMVIVEPLRGPADAG
jgi:hypothetical protein